MKTLIGTLIVIWLGGIVTVARARGPVYDPFLESFQVGKYAKVENLVLAQGFPAELFTPAVVDSAWIGQALLLLEPQKTFADPQPVIWSWLKFSRDPLRLKPWRQNRRRVLDFLLSGQVPPKRFFRDNHGPLVEALLATTFFQALAAGDTNQAVVVAQKLAHSPQQDPGSSASRFIWDLRVCALSELIVPGAKSRTDTWPSMFDLGPFDAQSGFAVWSAHRKARGLPLLTKSFTTKGQASFLAGLRNSRLHPHDLAASGFSLELKEGLGAKVLRGQDRISFMESCTRPPWDFEAQGWWVSGLRKNLHGRAAGYEKHAAGTQLRSGWRMDLWRRASELRLLQGQWPTGIHDLRQAVGLARYGAGSPSLRKRLRQWVEQALALAVSKGDTLRAAEIFELGKSHLPEKDSETFISRTQAWFTGQRTGQPAVPVIELDVAGNIRSGAAEGLSGRPDRPELPSSALLRLSYWRQWAETGQGILSRSGRHPDLRLAYSHLRQQPSPTSSRAEALQLIFAELADKALSFELLDRVLDRDVYLQTQTGGGAPPSAWPLFKALCGTDPDLWHGFWGLALAQQDLRAVVGLVSLPQAIPLPSEKKLHFLYPLPAFGPTRKALVDAKSELALLLAVARNESLFDAGIRSRAGALGWMQVMPFHFPALGAIPGTGHWSNPVVSIGKGDELLVENQRRFGGDPYRTVAAYNAGPSAALRWQKQLGQKTVPPAIYLAWIGYPETRWYVEKVLRDRKIYEGILGLQNELPAQ